MRILFVAPYFPIPQRSGGKVRVFHVLRELARTEQVTLACYVSRQSKPFIRDVERWGVDVHCISREVERRPVFRHLRFLPTSTPFSLVDPDRRMQDLVGDLWAKHRYDLLQIEFLAMAYVGEEPMFEGRRFLTHHYSATDHYKRALGILPKSSPRHWMQRVDAAKVPSYERRMLGQFASVFVTSDQDRQLLSAVAPRARLVVANNGVDVDFYRSERQENGAETKLLISTCSFLTDTNIDSVVWFLDEIWPRISRKEPQARYEIIGYDPPAAVRDAAARASGVSVLGGVEDVRPYLDRAVASLITMRAGSGTKIRALTSLAMGLPVIATPLGAEGLQAGEREGVFVSETPEAIANLALRLLTTGVQPSTRQRARSYVKQQHSWENAVDTMRAAYQERLGR